MTISTKGRYGLRAMVDLALRFGSEPTPLKELASRQNIPLKYLEQIFSLLNKAGLVKSIKGAQGGYLLAYRPAEITVEQIFVALEGDFLVEEEPVTDLSDVCITLNDLVYKKLSNVISSTLSSITLESIIIAYKRAVTENITFII